MYNLQGKGVPSYENCIMGILVYLGVIKISKKCKKVTIIISENSSNIQYLIGRRKLLPFFRVNLVLLVIIFIA